MDEPTDAPEPELLTIGEAARRSGVSAKTIRRRLQAGELEGAHKRPGPKGDEWAIPASALGPEAAAPPDPEPAQPLREELAAWRLRALAAEALAHERAEHLGVLRRAVEMLEQERAAPPPAPEPSEEPAAAPPVTPPIPEDRSEPEPAASGVAPAADAHLPPDVGPEPAPAAPAAPDPDPPSPLARRWAEPLGEPTPVAAAPPVTPLAPERIGRLPWVPWTFAALAVVVRLAGHAQAHDVTPAELAVARLSQGDGGAFGLSWFSHPPLLPILSAVAAFPADAPDVIDVAHLTRVWGALAAGVVAWASWRLANRAGAGLASFLAAVIVVVDPAILLGAVHATPVLVALALLLTGHVVLLDRRRRLTPRRAVGVGLLYGAALLASYSVAPLLVAVPLMMSAIGARPLLGRVLVAGGLVGGSFPLAALLAGEIGSLVDLHWDVPRLADPLELSGGPGRAGITALVAAAVLATALLATRRSPVEAPVTAHLVVTVVSAGSLALMGAAPFDQVLLLTSCAAIGVPLVLAVAAARRPMLARDAVITGIAIAVVVASVGTGVREVNRTRDRADDVASQLLGEIDAGDRSVVAGPGAVTARLLGAPAAPPGAAGLLESGADAVVLSDRLHDRARPDVNPLLDGLGWLDTSPELYSGRTAGAVAVVDIGALETAEPRADEPPVAPVPTTAAPATVPPTTAPPTTAPPTTAAPTTAPPTTAAPTAAPAPRPEPTERARAVPGDTVQVVAGEHFWAIAERVVRDVDPAASLAAVTAYWASLIDANLDRLPDPSNPDLVFVGQQLVLPPLT